MATEHRYDPTQMYASDYPLLAEGETIASGEDLPQGAIVGRITANGKWALCLDASTDGSEVARGIMPVAVDASAGDVIAPIWKSGHFNSEALTFGTGKTLANVRSDFDGTPLFLTAVAD